MILGKGAAQTEQAIFDEYRCFVTRHHSVKNSKALVIALQTPECLRQRIGKPLGEWTDDDLLEVYADRGEATQYRYNLFLTFLLFHGYRQASFRLLTQVPSGFTMSLYHREALTEYREKIETLGRVLGYFPDTAGGVLSLLIALLALLQKPLNSITRADFDTFADQHRTWYRSQKRLKDGRPKRDLKRLEYYLIHWGILSKAKPVGWHEINFAGVTESAVRSAVLTFMKWCEAKFQPGTIGQYELGLRLFAEWFQRRQSTWGRLDQVTRQCALAFAQYLRDEHQCTQLYTASLYRTVYRFYEFVLNEHFETVPNRNPFSMGDLPKSPDIISRYLTDQEVRKVLEYCSTEASLRERVLVTVLFHTGVRVGEVVNLKVPDIVQVQGKWKLHIREGKGLKDRLIPLTTECLAALQAWQDGGWEKINDYLFTRHGRQWQRQLVTDIIKSLGVKIGVPALKPHRFRHTFAVALLNYGMRESALQKIMGHVELSMTLHYARILDQTVEKAFSSAVEQMQEGPLNWVPNFLKTGDYSLFVEGDAVSWIRLPLGYCRRNPKLHCESDVKCLLCDRFAAAPEDLQKLKAMHERFQSLGMQIKADVVATQVRRLERQGSNSFISVAQIA